MPLILYPDLRLHKAAKPRPVDDGLRAVGHRLLAAAEAAQAYGLAAIHMGTLAPVVVISVATNLQTRDYRLLFNPEVLEVAPKTESGKEGSVSLPGIEVEVKRPVWAEVAYDDRDGMRQQARFRGFVARVALHEIDQMNGVFFLDRAE